MNKKIFLVLLLPVMIIPVYVQELIISEQQKKIEFLENALATKNLEYEWLSEIIDSFVYENSDLQEKFKELIENRIQQPKI